MEEIKIVVENEIKDDTEKIELESKSGFICGLFGILCS